MAGGRSANVRAIQIEAMPPRITCPSAPMFQIWQRKESDTEMAISSSGVAWTSVSVKRSTEPKAPNHKLW